MRYPAHFYFMEEYAYAFCSRMGNRLFKLSGISQWAPRFCVSSANSLPKAFRVLCVVENGGAVMSIAKADTALNPDHYFAALKLIEQLYRDGQIPAYMFRNILNDYAGVVDLSKFTIYEEKEETA